MMALQVQTDGLKNKRPPEGSLVFCMVRPKRFELLTPWFVAKYSIQLSYGRVRRELYANLVLFPAEIKQFAINTPVFGGERGIRTLDTDLSPYASLAGKCLRPLGQLSVLLLCYEGVTILDCVLKINVSLVLASA